MSVVMSIWPACSYVNQISCLTTLGTSIIQSASFFNWINNVAWIECELKFEKY